MKATRFDGVLVALAGLLVMAIGLCLILLVANVLDTVGMFAIELLLGSTWQVVAAYAFSALLILWGLRLCVFAWRCLRG